MNSKEALDRLLKYANLITQFGYSALNDINIIKQDLDRLETFDYITEQNVELIEENEELKSIIEELSEKIAKDSAEMSSMNSELRKLKGGFIPENYEVLGND